jgi:hypothetical protein
MNLKRLLIAMVMAASLLTIATSANAAVWWPSGADNLTSATFAMETQENFASTQGFSTLFNSKDQLCETLGQAPCENVLAETFTGSYVLPVCQTAAQQLCLEKVNIYRGTKASAKLIRQIDAPTAKVDSTLAPNIPVGGSTSLWTGADAKTYAVSIEAEVLIAKGKVTANSFAAVVNPYTTITGPYKGAKIVKNDSGTSLENQTELACAWVETGLCGELQDFDPGVRVGLTFRIGKPKDQFFSARLAKPTLGVAKAPGSNQISFSVEGEPVSVQQLSIKLPTSNPPKNLNLGAAPRGRFDYPVDSTAIVSALRAVTNNQASGVRTFWQLTNEDDSRVTQPTKCKASSGVAGLIATDAMVADAFSPTKVGGHLKLTSNGLLNNPNGKADSGNLDLVLSADFARCTFGLSKVGSLKIAIDSGNAKSQSGSTWVSSSVNAIRYGSLRSVVISATR